MSVNGNVLDLVAVFGAGVLMSFTPCVYPLLPVTAATVAGVNTQGTHVKGFFLSLLYVLGMAVSYSALALVAALTGRVFGTLQNSPWVFLAVGNVFLFFALVFFDVIPVPQWALPGAGQRPRGVKTLFLTGFASGFVIGPCTAPALGALLIYIGSKQNVLWGAVLVWVFALGLGASLILAGTFSGFLAALPRSGAWMEMVKRVAGVIMVVIAEIFLLKAGALF